MSPEEKRDFVVQQEPDHVDRTKLRRVAVLAALAMAAALGATVLLLRKEADERAHQPAAPPQAPAQVGTVETSLILATERGITLRAEQRRALGQWGWVDRDAGVARIPIERAMEILVEHPEATDGGARP